MSVRESERVLGNAVIEICTSKGYDPLSITVKRLHDAQSVVAMG